MHLRLVAALDLVVDPAVDLVVALAVVNLVVDWVSWLFLLFWLFWFRVS